MIGVVAGLYIAYQEGLAATTRLRLQNLRYGEQIVRDMRAGLRTRYKLNLNLHEKGIRLWDVNVTGDESSHPENLIRKAEYASYVMKQGCSEVSKPIEMNNWIKDLLFNAN